MKEVFSINVNNQVRVILTPAGLAIYNAQMRFHGLPEKVVEYFTGPLNLIEGPLGPSLTVELWDLMFIFGGEMYMGNPRVPFFLNNNIEVLP